jgi:hypothetical protein
MAPGVAIAHQWIYDETLFEGKGVPSNQAPDRATKFVTELERQRKEGEDNIFVLYGEKDGLKLLGRVVTIEKTGMTLEPHEDSDIYVPFQQIWEIQWEKTAVAHTKRRTEYVKKMIIEYEADFGPHAPITKEQIAREAADRYDLMQELDVPGWNRLENPPMTKREISAVLREVRPRRRYTDQEHNERYANHLHHRKLQIVTARLSRAVEQMVERRTPEERLAVGERMPLVEPEDMDLDAITKLCDLHQLLPAVNWTERLVVTMDKERADEEQRKQQASCPFCDVKSSPLDGYALRREVIRDRSCAFCSNIKEMFSYRCCNYQRVTCLECASNNNFATPQEPHDANAPALPPAPLQPPAQPVFDPLYESDDEFDI